MKQIANKQFDNSIRNANKSISDAIMEDYANGVEKSIIFKENKMKFTVYSKDGCNYCYKVKQILELTGSNFVVYNLGEDFTKDQFYAEFGEGSTFPQVICDDKKLGGCSDTVKYLKEKQIV